MQQRVITLALKFAVEYDYNQSEMFVCVFAIRGLRRIVPISFKFQILLYVQILFTKERREENEIPLMKSFSDLLSMTARSEEFPWHRFRASHHLAVSLLRR